MLLINRLISSFILIFIFFNLKAQQFEFTEEYSPQINQNSLFKLNMYDSGAKNLWKTFLLIKTLTKFLYLSIVYQLIVKKSYSGNNFQI